jgi:hypothetical protein
LTEDLSGLSDIVTPPEDTLEPKALPQDAYDVVVALYERHTDLANSSNDDDRRTLQKMICETVFARKGDGWGWKSNHGIGISPAKDAIAQLPNGAVFTPNQRQPLYIWDCFNGTTRRPNAAPIMSGPESENRQFFMPVDPIDHLGGTEPPTPTTHKYNGGGNDTGICDTCGKNRFDPIHAIPESKVTHVYDGGEQDTGLCDVCQRPKSDSIHVGVVIPPVDESEAIKTLRKDLDQLRVELAAARKDTTDLGSRVTLLETPGEHEEAEYMLVEDKNPKSDTPTLSTSRAAYHGHTTRYKIIRKSK